MRRFCVVALFFGLMWMSPLMADSHEVSGTADGHHRMDSGHKKKHKSFKFYYGWGLSLSDENISRRRGADEDEGSDDYDEDDNSGADVKLRSIESSSYAGLLVEKKWKGVTFELDFEFLDEDTPNTALVTAEIPRSYVSITAGKGTVPAVGLEHSSPYISYHRPFPYYAPMVKAFVPVEGIGELGIIIVNDVSGDGWNNKSDSITGIAEYSGDLGLVHPHLQFAMYDYGKSYLVVAGARVAVENAAFEFDYIRDNRTLEMEDAEDSSVSHVLNNASAELSYTHDEMVKAYAEFAMFWREGVDNKNNPNPMWKDEEASEGEDADEGDEDADEGDEKQKPRTYEELSKAEKYANNMMRFALGVAFDCMKGKLVPSIEYNMKSHNIDALGEGDEMETRMSHSLIFAIEGSI